MRIIRFILVYLAVMTVLAVLPIPVALVIMYVVGPLTENVFVGLACGVDLVIIFFVARKLKKWGCSP